MIPQYKQQRLMDHIDETLEALRCTAEFLPPHHVGTYDIIVKDLQRAKDFIEGGVFSEFNEEADVFKLNTGLGGMIDYHFDMLFGMTGCSRKAELLQHLNKAIDAWSEAQSICSFIIQDIFG